MAWQKTIRRAVSVQGVGIHGGEQVSLQLRPAPPGTGVVFVRTDLGISIPARAENARDLAYATTLRIRGAEARTVEHLMAAVGGTGVTNLFVDLSAAEVPILDGSSLPFVELLQRAGIADQGASLPELHVRRGVQLDSFLFDDGWDDPRTLWRFNAGFPHGFTSLREAATRFGAAPGVWMSPWGGYGDPREQRLRYGREQGFETNAEGFALSGPRYYARFRETALDMIRTYGVNQFKIDGTGSASSSTPGSQFDSDFDAAISLIAELRAEKPDLFVNLTTGTYPSPFWLRYADSTWRGGDDHEFAGVGTDRQRWITYRDGDTYGGVVRQGPLYPLNSLMLHGLIYARHAHGLMTDPANDFTSEVRSYFGTGTQLQEMYVTPSLLTPGNWDALAEAAQWSRRNADALVDTHWVGGDPWRLEPYGWASWTPAKATLVLRNPKDAPQRIAVDVAEAFELPAGAPRRYRARSPWAEDRGKGPLALSAGTPHVFRLAPFEVLTLDAVP